MRIIIFIILINTILIQNILAIDNNVHIEKTDEGYDIYSTNNELLLRFTKTNSDSSELETIKNIYDNQNEINSKILDKMIIISKTDNKNGWEIAIAIAQIMGVAITSLVLWLTYKKLRKDNAYNDYMRNIKEKEFQIERNKYLKSIRPEFVYFNKELLEIEEGKIIKCWYSSMNIGERAYNVSIILDTDKNIINNLNIKLCNNNLEEAKNSIACKLDTVRNKGGAAFTYMVPINTPTTLIELNLTYSDIDGNKYIQIINAYTDGKFSISPPTLLE